MNNETNYIFKYIIIGDSGVGKSSILNKYMNNKYDYEMNSTIGVEFYTKSLKIDEKKY